MESTIYTSNIFLRTFNISIDIICLSLIIYFFVVDSNSPVASHRFLIKNIGTLRLHFPCTSPLHGLAGRSTPLSFKCNYRRPDRSVWYRVSPPTLSRSLYRLFSWRVSFPAGVESLPVKSPCHISTCCAVILR